MFKKVLTTALAAVMALGAVVAVNPSVVKADEYTAKFSFASEDWGASVWGDTDTTKTTVTGEGTYSFSWEPGATITGAQVFVVDIEGAGEAYKGWSVKDVSVKLDGTELAVDASKIIVDDTEQKGNLRISFFNPNNAVETTVKEDAPFDYSALTFSSKIELTFTLTSETGLNKAGNWPEDGGDDDSATETKSFDPAGKYNAYFGLQSPSWTYRDPWNSDNGIGSANWGQWVKNNDANNKEGATYGVVTDAEVAGNGTYTVSLKDFGTIFADEFANNADNLDKFRILMITTDIPLSDDVKVTDVKLIMDGKTIKTYKEAFLDGDDKEYVKILIQNEWNPDLKETLPFYAAPTESIELQFTIEGFNYDNENAKADEPATTPATNNDANSDNDGNNDKGGIDPVVVVIIVVVVVAVVAAVVVVSKKKKN